MPRYWIIAPIESEPRELFEKVWKFDVDNNLISIGWKELGDVSNMSREQLSEAVAATYSKRPPQTKILFANMLWAFHHEISPGDFIIARRGRKMLASVGRVTQSAFYSPGRTRSVITQTSSASHGRAHRVKRVLRASYSRCIRLAKLRMRNSALF